MVAEPMSVAPRSAPQKIWTYEEVQARFDDDVCRELYDGEIWEMPSPTWNHQDAILQLAFFLMQWAREHGGKVVLSPIDLYVSARRYFIPDLCFYGAQKLAEQPVLADLQKLRVPPDLIVEVLSPSTARNDRIRKLQIYAEFGVPHYWLLDPETRSLEALELVNEHYLIAHALEGEASFSSPLFPGLTLSLPELFSLSPASAETA